MNSERPDFALTANLFSRSGNNVLDALSKGGQHLRRRATLGATLAGRSEPLPTLIGGSVLCAATKHLRMASGNSSRNPAAQSLSPIPGSKKYTPEYGSDTQVDDEVRSFREHKPRMRSNRDKDIDERSSRASGKNLDFTATQSFAESEHFKSRPQHPHAAMFSRSFSPSSLPSAH
jgi:hypothetical protein